MIGWLADCTFLVSVVAFVADGVFIVVAVVVVVVSVVDVACWLLVDGYSLSVVG